MADIRKTIEIIFAGVDNVTSTVLDVNNSIGDFSGKVETATQPLANMASSIAKTETALAALGLATLAYAHGQAVDLQDAETSLQKVLKESEGSVDQYAGSIKELSLEYGVAATEVTGSAAQYKQSSFTIAESLGLVDTTLKAVQIAELSASEASFLLISNIRGIGAEADVATHFLDAWNAVSNEYATTAKEVAVATGLLAPIAKTAGLSFDELVGLATPMIEVLGSGAVVGTALKVSLANLISPTSRVTEALSELGISQRDANGELKLSGELISEVATKWPDLTISQQANYGLLLFGKEHYSKMNIVLNDYDKVLKVTELSINSQNSATEEWIVKQKTAEIASQRLNVALTNAASTIGKQYIDSTTDVTNSLTNLIGTFDQVVSGGGLKPLFDLLNPLLDEFSDNIDIIAKNLPDAFANVDFTGLIKSFKDIGLEFGSLFDGADLTTTEGLTEAIQGITDGLTVLNNLFAGVVDGFSPVIEAFKFLAEEANEAEGSTSKFIGYIIGTGASVNVFAGLLGGLSSAFGALADVIIIVAGASALGLLPDKFLAIVTSLSKLTGAIALVGGAFAGGFKLGTVIGETETVKGLFTSLFEAFDKLTDGPISQVNEEFKTLAKTETDVVESSEKLVQSTKDLTAEATKYDDVVNDMSDANTNAKESAEALSESEERLAEHLASIGINAETGAKEIKKIEDAASGASGKITEFGDAATGLNTELLKTKKSTNDAKEGLNALDSASDGSIESMKALKNELGLTGKEAVAASLELKKMEVQLEDIASNERIRAMELSVDIKVANIEADTKKVVASFESISTSYAATSDLIGSLFQTDAPDWDRFGFDIERATNQAVKIQQEQHNKQMELLDAQIEQMTASTEALESGDGLITISNEGLAPEIEAFMEVILENLRIKMATNQLSFLSGACGETQ